MSDRLSDADLGRLEALAEGATPGPWERVTSQRIDGPDYAEVIYPGQVECMAYCYGGSSTIEGYNLDADTEFIAAARNALPALLAEVRASREREAARSRDMAHLEYTPECVTDAVFASQAHWWEPGTGGPVQPVMMPLLLSEVADAAWATSRDFLAKEGEDDD